MKKCLLSMLAAVVAGAVVSCSKDNRPDGQQEITGGGTLTTRIVFEEAAASKAAALSTAIPVTSWANIKQVQLFLYDASGIVKYSDVITPSAGATTYTWTDVPAGTYTAALVANVKSTTDNVTTYLDGGATPAAWTKFNVRSKSVNSQLVVAHKPSAFPAFVSADYAGKSAFAEPAEIFTGYASGVTVATGATTDLSSSPVSLRREVALMRVRVKTNDQTDADNTDLVFAHADASILIHRLPDGMKIGQGSAGGVETTSTDNNILVAASGLNTFNTANPATGYGPGSIIDADYTLWRDVVVFPNDAGRTNTSPNVQAAADRQYFIVVSAHAPQGHVLADGTTVSAVGGQAVYWSGLIREAFVPNIIREVNLSLRSGGTVTPPPAPTQEGGLTVEVSAPAAWNSNIERTDIEL